MAGDGRSRAHNMNRNDLSGKHHFRGSIFQSSVGSTADHSVLVKLLTELSSQKREVGIPKKVDHFKYGSDKVRSDPCCIGGRNEGTRS